MGDFINARSLWPKLQSFAALVDANDIDLAMITEIWGKGKKKDLFEIKKL